LPTENTAAHIDFFTAQIHIRFDDISANQRNEPIRVSGRAGSQRIHGSKAQIEKVFAIEIIILK
jgi:hypothetical protein